MLFGQELGLGLAKAHSAALTAALHAVHEEDPHPDQQDERQKRQQKMVVASMKHKLHHIVTLKFITLRLSLK